MVTSWKGGKVMDPNFVSGSTHICGYRSMPRIEPTAFKGCNAINSEQEGSTENMDHSKLALFFGHLELLSDAAGPRFSIFMAGLRDFFHF